MSHSENGQNGDVMEESEEDNLIKGYSGKVTGIIIPPPEIRAIADKTSQWVAKNGKSFEQRILSSEEGKSNKFNFMRPGDVYYAYYEDRIRFFEEGNEPPEKKPKVAPVVEPAKPKEAEQTIAAPTKSSTTTIGKATVLGPIARAALNRPSEPPPPLEFLLVHPEGLTAMEVEIIKLTAQYTAASGRQFLAGLAQREQRNPMFDFLKPTHLLFSYFTALVDCYSKILTPVASQKARIAAGTDKNKVLERAVHRHEWQKEEEDKKKSEKAEMEAEKVAYQSVDWHDFVVVETINFDEDELLEVATAGEEEDMDMDMDMEDEQAPPPPPKSAPPPPPPPPRRVVDMDTDETEIKVVSDYTPTLGGGYKAPETMFDPVSGMQVPIAQLDEHMRIQLLDPRWREEQKRALEKKKESALAEGTDIAANVRRFAQKRTDIFGTVEEEERALLEEQEVRRRREVEANRIIWDGSAASAQVVQQQTMERIAENIQRGHSGLSSLSQTSGPQIGPAVPAPSRPPPPPPSFMQQNTLNRPPPPPSQPPPPFQPPPFQMQMQQGGPPMPPPGPPPPPPRPPTMEPPFQHPLPPEQDVEMDMDDDSNTTGGQGGLQAEDDFAAMFQGPVVLAIKCPEDDANPQWNLRGQLISLSVPGVKASLKEVKELLTPMLGGMPPNKMQLKSPASGFLKDSQTLASYNIAGNMTLELLTRSRGKR